jgi:hypothetical protein
MSPEGLECPRVAFLVVAYHVCVTVVGADAEINGTRAVPSVIHTFDMIDAVAELEP